MNKTNFPANLLCEMHLNETMHTNLDYGNLTNEQTQSLQYLVECLPPREQRILLAYYRDGFDLSDLPRRDRSMTLGQIRQILCSALQKLRSKPWLVYLVVGHCRWYNHLSLTLRSMEQAYQSLVNCKNLEDALDYLPLSPRVTNALHRANIHSVADLLAWYTAGSTSRHIYAIGPISTAEIRSALLKENLIPAQFQPVALPCVPAGLDLKFYALMHLMRFRLGLVTR